MNKYLEGSIYTNNYLEGYAGGLSVIMGGFLYAKAGMKGSLVTSFGLALLTGVIVCVLEGHIVDLPHSYLHQFGNPQHLSDKKLTSLALDYLVPKFIFIAKFSM